MPQLKVNCDGTVFEVELGDKAYVIGRGDDADIKIEEPVASRKHCQIEPTVDGFFKIVDLQSRNGTYLNGRKISSSVLREGDVIKVGETTLAFDEEMVGSPDETPPPTMRRSPKPRAVVAEPRREVREQKPKRAWVDDEEEEEESLLGVAADQMRTRKGPGVRIQRTSSVGMIFGFAIVLAIFSIFGYWAANNILNQPSGGPEPKMEMKSPYSAEDLARERQNFNTTYSRYAEGKITLQDARDWLNESIGRFRKNMQDGGFFDPELDSILKQGEEWLIAHPLGSEPAREEPVHDPFGSREQGSRGSRSTATPPNTTTSAPSSTTPPRAGYDTSRAEAQAIWSAVKNRGLDMVERLDFSGAHELYQNFALENSSNDYLVDLAMDELQLVESFARDHFDGRDKPDLVAASRSEAGNLMRAINTRYRAFPDICAEAARIAGSK
ncbi:MAG: FHA domain-containing protein [Planctomycetes bacterium]|nr:FHA domain-containing protein [Planctomycetota bacterium]